MYDNQTLEEHQQEILPPQKDTFELITDLISKIPEFPKNTYENIKTQSQIECDLTKAILHNIWLLIKEIINLKEWIANIEKLPFVGNNETILVTELCDRINNTIGDSIHAIKHELKHINLHDFCRLTFRCWTFDYVKKHEEIHKCISIFENTPTLIPNTLEFYSHISYIRCKTNIRNVKIVNLNFDETLKYFKTLIPLTPEEKIQKLEQEKQELLERFNKLKELIQN